MAAQETWDWFYPPTITAPDCVRQLLEFIYPSVDWDKVSFHNGFPHAYKLNDKNAVTVPHTFGVNRVRIYFREGKWDPCSCDGLGLIVHEGFHVLQMQDIAGGFGLGLASPTVISYLACWAANGFDYDGHPAEDAAYAVAGHSNSLFETCCSAQPALPCDCGCSPPSVDVAAMQAFQAACVAVVQKSSGATFWGGIAECTPGLEEIADAAKWVWENFCGWRPGGVNLVLPCVVGGVVSGVLWVIYGIYYVIWLLIWTVVAIILAVVQGVVEIVGGIIGGAVSVVEGIWDAISSPWSDPAAAIWYTSFDGTAWDLPDHRITTGGHTKTSDTPALAVLGSSLYAAYRSSDGDDLWYNVFDGTNWLAQDKKITADGHTRSSRGPAMAEYGGQLYLAYRSSSNSDLWYNVFDGTDWLAQDKKITTDGHTKTSAAPSLAVYDGLLYLAYRSSTNSDIWYNVFDGNDWMAQDKKISTNGRTRTSAGPTLAAYDGLLYLVYRASNGSDLWYNTFDGKTWRDEDCRLTEDGHARSARGPAAAAFGTDLMLVYRDDS